MKRQSLNSLEKGAISGSGLTRCALAATVFAVCFGVAGHADTLVDSPAGALNIEQPPKNATTTGRDRTLRDLAIAPERRCAPYQRHDYPYPPGIETRIIATLGGRVHEPYIGRYFRSRRHTDIEHIVALSEAHDSGLCAADSATKHRFATDILNLTLATPKVNRCGAGDKRAHDAAAWLPLQNKCWFAARVVAVKHKYALSVDAREAAALEGVLVGCKTTDMVMPGDSVPQTPTAQPLASEPGRGGSDALRHWDDNANDRITCREARRHGIAPVRRSHPAYPFMRDGDGDGIVCE